MENYASIIPELLKLSPIAAVLFICLAVVWKYVQKKDEALTQQMNHHNEKLLEMQEKTIVSNNQLANSNTQLAGAIGDLTEVVESNQTRVLRELDELKAAGKTKPLRRPTLITEPSPARA